jgi:acetyl esterase
MGRISYQGRLDPQMRAALEKQNELAPEIGEMHKIAIHELRRLYDSERRYWNADGPDLPEIKDDTIPGPLGTIPVRFYFPNPKRPLPGLVYLHGGGFVLGSLDTHDRIMRLLAQKSGAAVIGVDYRLSPEHKFPTALEEAAAVVKYLRKNGTGLGIDADRLAMGGDSAGANISIGASLMVRSEYPDLLKILLLFYGIYGLRDSGSRRLFGGPEDGLGEENLAFYQKCYLNRNEDAADPRYNVLGADLRGLPPLFIGAVEHDPLFDDSVTLKKIADADRVPNELKIYRGVLHGFLHLSRMVDTASRALEDAAASLRNALLSSSS